MTKLGIQFLRSVDGLAFCNLPKRLPNEPNLPRRGQFTSLISLTPPSSFLLELGLCLTFMDTPPGLAGNENHRLCVWEQTIPHLTPMSSNFAFPRRPFGLERTRAAIGPAYFIPWGRPFLS